MSRHRTLALLALLFAGALPSEAKMYERPRSFKYAGRLKAADAVDRRAVPPIDAERLAAAERERQRAARRPDRQERPDRERRPTPPLRFAEPAAAGFNVANSGTWEPLPDGSRLWRLRISAPGSKHLNLGFSRFDLPAGAKLWLYNADGSYVEGPYTRKHRSDKGRFFTPIIPGDEVVVELWVPAGAGEPTLEIETVNRGFFGFKSGGPFKSGTCNNDVRCPEGSPWQDQIRAVAVYTLSGAWTCTGTLLNNTAGDFKNYFLSAAHCEVDSSNDDTMVVYWNYESPNCGDQGSGDLSQNQSGATFRAAGPREPDIDFLLVELASAPDPDFQVYYAGWDVSGATPGASVGIHHPSTDEKAITFNNDALTTTDCYDDTPDPSETHWRIDEWEDGTTEPGSSGSCLFDPATKRCVGWLSGGYALCSAQDESDWYGKFSVGWEWGSTSATRLRDWLNPANDGTTAVEGVDAPAAPGGPRIRIEQVALDYGQVELGFAFTKAIVIHNDGDADLTVSVTNPAPADPDLSHFTIDLVADEVINPGDPPLVVQETYEPTAAASHTVSLTVTSDDPALPSQAIVLTGEGIAPIPIDSVLVLDRSGSMGETAGARTKIEALQKAADLYVHLLRPDISGVATGDQIAFAKYNQANSVYLTLGEAEGAHLTDAEDKLSDAALSDSARLQPTGATGIGGGMQTGAGTLPLPSGPRKHVMVVLTDGIENRDPRIGDVLGPITGADPDLKIYSVGLGTNIEPGKLQQITNVANGYHQVSDDLSGTSYYDLETFYFKIFANATGMQIAVDPTVPVALGGTGPVIVSAARITSSDRSATFVVFDEPSLRHLYDLELVSPQGVVVQLGTPIGGVPVHRLQRSNYTIYRTVFPDLSQAAQFVGDWLLRLRPKQIAVPIIKSANKAVFDDNTVPIGFVAAVGSNYRMGLTLSAIDYVPGAPFDVSIALTDRGWPSPRGRIVAQVTTPAGAVRDVPLGPAGDGVWTGRFTDTATPGSYRVFVRAVGRNHLGETVIREDVRFISLVPGGARPCVPCCGGSGGGAGEGPDAADVARRGRWSAHLGSTHPLGDLDDVADANVHARLDWTREVTRRWGFSLFAGLSQLTAESATGLPHPRFLNLSVNLQALFPRPSGLTWFLEGGPGWYDPKSGSAELGFNLGGGARVPLRAPFAIELSLDYHQVTGDADARFLTAQLGLLVR